MGENKAFEDVISVNRVKFKQLDKEFAFYQLSLGTRRIIELVDIFLNEDKECVYLIDEVDRSFHTLLTKHIISEFCKLNNKSQLIATTHDIGLMDINDFRHDQLIFVDRDVDLNSNIVHLKQFDIRKDKLLIKDYLNGRYGSTPSLVSIRF